MLLKLFFAIACLAILVSSATVKERYTRNILETGSTNAHQLGQHSELNKESHTKLGVPGNLDSSPTEKSLKQKREVENKLAEPGKPASQPSNEKSTHVLGGVSNPNSQVLEHTKQKREFNDKLSENGSPTSQPPNKQIGGSDNYNSNIPQSPKKKREASSSPVTVTSSPSETSNNKPNESTKNSDTTSPSKQKRESEVSTITTERAIHALEKSKIIQISKGEGVDKKEVIKTTT